MKYIFFNFPFYPKKTDGSQPKYCINLNKLFTFQNSKTCKYAADSLKVVGCPFEDVRANLFLRILTASDIHTPRHTSSARAK